MKHSIDRRTFLGASLALGATALIRGPRASAAALGPCGARRSPNAPVLVVVQLGGGNDGLNTVVPYADDAYHRARRRIAIGAKDVLDLDGHVGLAPQLARLHANFGEGHVAVVQGAGYPEPNRSHFKAMEIWHTARATGRESGPGWLGRLAVDAWEDDVHPDRSVHVGGAAPYALYSRRHPAISLETPRNYRWAGNGEDIEGLDVEEGARAEADRSQVDFLRDVMRAARSSSLAVRRAVASYRPAVEYERDDLSQSLAVCAALIDAQIGSQVLSVEHKSYDTHAGQANRHAALLSALDTALDAFMRDLRAKERDREVVVLVFSEFGRRVGENASAGTDHGTAGPMFVLGTPVAGGLFGEQPALTDLDERGDMRHAVDFRSVYATIADRHFGAAAEAVLGARYPQLDLLPRRAR